MKKLASQIVQYIAVSSELFARQQEKAAAAEALQKAAAEKVTPVLQTLIDAGCVKPSDKQMASQFLSKHASTLDLLNNAAKKIAELTAQVKQASIELGSPDVSANAHLSSGSKSTNSDTASEGANYVGRRFRREKTAADVAFLSIMNPPKKA